MLLFAVECTSLFDRVPYFIFIEHPIYVLIDLRQMEDTNYIFDAKSYVMGARDRQGPVIKTVRKKKQLCRSVQIICCLVLSQIF